jgi:hypothetical protein
MKTDFNCENCGHKMVHNVSTENFLSTMDLDQLYFCLEKTQSLIKIKNNESKVTLLRVCDDWTNFAFFPETDYDSAVKCLQENIKEMISRGRPLKNLSIEPVKVLSSEVDDYLNMG